ncbi:MAG: hypothetical protein KF784_12575 [Fimbriimonadaceae bacterium]|nr:hypothetical protein [Fimbriimonadaceae bacterium]
MFEPRRLNRWHLLLLPPMHIALMAMIVSMATTSKDSIQVVSELGKTLYIWHRWDTLIATLFVQVGFLGIVLILQRVWLSRKSR